MKDIRSFIESGIIESYALGMASEEEARLVESMVLEHPEVKEELDGICHSLEHYANANAAKPHGTVKPMIMATIDYMERLEHGEKPKYPPIIYEGSKAEDYKEWLERPDMVAPEDFDNLFAKFIIASPKVTTAILWIREMAPDEVHTDEHEKFLILEGTCDIIVNDEVYHLKAGDVFTIPLHANHQVKVTSSIPCKAILERTAA